MNENIDLTKILKDCPEGTPLYSTTLGDVKLKNVIINDKTVYPIIVIDVDNTNESFTADGKMVRSKGECTLFPSKDQRDWSKFTAPRYKKEKFDPNTLKPFDKVLVRIGKNAYKWSCDLFSYINNDTCRYHGVGYCAKYCIPYNDETKHLLGTTDEAPEYYRYWEN